LIANYCSGRKSPEICTACPISIGDEASEAAVTDLMHALDPNSVKRDIFRMWSKVFVNKHPGADLAVVEDAALQHAGGNCTNRE